MLCRCGCGQDAGVYPKTLGSRKKGDPRPYVRYHWNKGRPRAVQPPPPNPSGICHCGCGQPAPLARQTDLRLGYVKGEPVRYIRGHVGYTKQRAEVTPDLWREEDRGFTSPCWIYALVPDDPRGYSRVAINGRRVLAHRAMYEQEVGPISKGLQIDHLCRVPRCINPAHLEVVTPAENIRRGVGTKLTMEIALEIRAAAGTHRAIADRFGISHSQVGAIKNGQAWI